MSGRVKVTGYLPLSDLPEEFLDDSDSTGLSEYGNEQITTYEGNPAYKIADLEDIELEREDD